MIELAHGAPGLGLLGKQLADAGPGQPVEDAELALAQALVDGVFDEGRIEAAVFPDDLGRPLRPLIGRGQDDLGPAVGRKVAEPGAQGLRLHHTPVAERDIDIPLLDGDPRRSGRVGGVARDVAGALAVTHHPEVFGPSRSHERPTPRRGGWLRRGARRAEIRSGV